MKKFLALLTSIIMLSCVTATAEYTVDDAFADFKEKHADFVAEFKAYNVSEVDLLSFLYDVYAYISEINVKTPVTPENFEENALIAISRVSSRSKYYPLQDALLILYPEAIKLAVTDGTVSEELRPVVETVKAIVFENGMLDLSQNTEPVSENPVSENPVSQSPVFTFTDLPETHWAYSAIKKLSEMCILNGYFDGTFKPDKNITRGEFAKIIVSATNTFDVSAVSSFSDVSTDAWYYHYVSSAFKNGYINGYPDGSFRPEENITRADICTIVHRSLGDTSLPNTAAFADDNLIPAYAKTAVYSLAERNIVNGMGENKFMPTAFATRAQTAKIIYEALVRQQ